MQKISIFAPAGIESGVESGVCGPDFQHGYLLREDGIQFVCQNFRVRQIVSVEMGNVADSIHAGIGAACSGYRRGCTQQRGQGFLKSLLYALFAGLDLPSVKAGSAV